MTYTSLILLEDETALREETSEFLTCQGFEVTATATIAEFRDAFRPTEHSIALLDLGLPDGDGISLIQEIRNARHDTGIIVITARGAFPEKISGLQNGADYYLTKPAQLHELAAIISALDRRMHLPDSECDDQWLLDSTNWRLSTPTTQAGSVSIRLSAQDFIIMRALIAACGQPVTRRELVAALGKNYLEYDQRRLDTQMRRLRSKVTEGCNLDLPIRTIHSVGYTFTARAKVI